ncbi:sensor histidine kinase KdpD [Pararhodobacter sp.]|uniref:sensor histidine kinase KdpD n=1 Tax=Pararhodobacter sp. TaxID=2127056 RepID=UPI002AFEFBDF|nr:sensor histidine kinase KdpD [Pararhodobacter sp.]
MMSETRPNPDQLLAGITDAEQQAARGKLKIFFGACPGVGKTYAMLQSLHQLHDDGEHILVGVAETHGRTATMQLVDGLPRLPMREVEYRGRTLREFDLDAALAAHPDLIAVDELAHSNLEGSRHSKRWQDVEELLAAGINVLSTLNVQHLASLNDTVGRITGIRVRETVPDHVFNQADDVVVIDLPADELLKRLAEGKVYMPDAAQRARAHFFRKGNLIALRELALRRAADRVDAQMSDYRRTRAIEAVWPTRERLLVGLSGTAEDEHLVQHAAQLARKLEADWIVAYVDVPKQQRDERAAHRVAKALTLAASLGAETTTLPGTDVADELVSFAKQRNINRVILGHRLRPLWRFWRHATANRIAHQHPELDLIVIARGPQPNSETAKPKAAPRRIRWVPYLWATLACLVASAVAWLLLRVFDPSNVVMLFLLTVVIVALRWGRGPGAWAAFLAVACFDFFFVPPLVSMAVSDVQFIFTFALMLGVALVIGQLTARFRHEARMARQRERRAITLAKLSHDLSGALTAERIEEIALKSFKGDFRAGIGLALPDAADRMRAVKRNEILIDESIAQWVYDHAQPAGAGTATLSAAGARYVPLKAPMRVRGVLALEFEDTAALDQPEEQRLLEGCCNQLALALERVHFVEVAQNTLVAIEGERMRNTLLSAMSHDLRTPLTTILGAAQTAAMQLHGESTETLVTSIADQAKQMLRLIENLLDMARLQSQGVELNRQWQSLEEILGVALHDLCEPLREHPVSVEVPADLPLLHVDALLMQRVLVNLLDNAAKHTPAGTPIDIRARHVGDNVLVEVSDDGPGLPQAGADKLFNPFEQGRPESATGGAGLGLALVRHIVEAHGATIEARQRSPKGAVFVITLPASPQPEMDSA